MVYMYTTLYMSSICCGGGSVLSVIILFGSSAERPRVLVDIRFMHGTYSVAHIIPSFIIALLTRTLI